MFSIAYRFSMMTTFYFKSIKINTFTRFQWHKKQIKNGIWLRKLYKIQLSLSYPMQITLQKKPPAHAAAGLQKNCENVNGSTPCTVSAACFKTTGTINKKNCNKMHFLKRLHKCLNHVE